MADDTFKLPGSSYDVLKMIIQAYASINKPASLEDASKRASMDKTSISRNVGFLLSVAILEGGSAKGVTQLGKKLGDAYSLDMEAEIEKIISQLVSKNEFMTDVTSAVKIRGGMDEASLRAHIAYSAGKSKSAGTTTGTGAVIDFLRDGGVLLEKDGKLVLRENSVSASGNVSTALDSYKSFVVREREKTSKPSSALPLRASTDGSLNINLNVKLNIDCKPEEVDEIGLKIRKMLDDLQATDDSEN